MKMIENVKFHLWLSDHTFWYPIFKWRHSYDFMVLCVGFKYGRQNVKSVTADLVQALTIYRWHLKIVSRG